MSGPRGGTDSSEDYQGDREIWLKQYENLAALNVNQIIADARTFFDIAAGDWETSQPHPAQTYNDGIRGHCDGFTIPGLKQPWRGEFG